MTWGNWIQAFQATLRNNRKSEHHIRHEDAGTAWLLQNNSDEAAGLVSGHHQGLVQYRDETENERWQETGRLDGSAFRISDKLTSNATSSRMEDYLKQHESVCGTADIPADSPIRFTGLTRRVLLSCLVDADHSDTASHYGNNFSAPIPQPRWVERLAKLDEYVSNLQRPDQDASVAEIERQRIRDDLYHACRQATTELGFRSSEAVVGSGKTTAIMAHLLKVAADHDMRHIIVVLPYTNIISQSVEVLRKALCLEGENPEEVVAEHHHQSEYGSLHTRHLTTLWQAPVIVTTAVQFFETLSSNHPSRLRKLHELPVCAVCIDEAHAALPADLWPVCWNWLREWVKNWGGHLVLASGSLPRFWELNEFRVICSGRDSGHVMKGLPESVKELSPELKFNSEFSEHQRVKYASADSRLRPEDLAEMVENSKGPRIVVVNTVQSAAFLASLFRERDKIRVLHLSTALAPIHRAVIVDRVKQMLKQQLDWVLVATSLVESGMDFSFANGYRQRSSAASLIQLGGRVNRNSDRGGECRVLDFDFAPDSKFPDNPNLGESKKALERLFANNWIDPATPCDLSSICLAAMKSEFGFGTQQRALSKVLLEKVDTNYPEVAEECRVIETDTRTVLVDQQLVSRLRVSGEKVSPLEIMRHSVQMSHQKITGFAIEPVYPDSDIFCLPENWKYDPEFLGFMCNIVEASKNPSLASVTCKPASEYDP